jgi:hypothetical protein
MLPLKRKKDEEVSSSLGGSRRYNPADKLS